MSIRRQAALVFCILMFSYSYVHQRLGWNQNSRLDLLRALFLHHTFAIDADQENTGDKAIHNGHYYSDKAPGVVFLAAPAFSLSISILHAGDVPLDSPKAWLISSWITTACSVGLITALGGVAIFLFLCRLVGGRYALPTTLAVFLGSSPFPYATMLFSHAAVIGLLCIALWAIADEVCGCGGDAATAGSATGERPKPWLKRYLLAGLCCGFAISSEYTAAIAAGGVLALAMLAGFKRSLVLALAAVPPLLLIPAYNWACFGSPLVFGYHNLALPEFQEMNKGLFGITFPPKLSSAYLILLSPERGLFFWTPFFVMSLFGLKRLFRTSGSLFWCCLLVVVLQILAISGYYMPSGGSALGARHLAPMLPFAAVMAAFGVREYPRLGVAYGLFSVAITGLATLIEAMPPEKPSELLLQFYLPQLIHGELAHQAGSHFGLPFPIGLAVIVGVLFLPFVGSWVGVSKLQSLQIESR